MSKSIKPEDLGAAIAQELTIYGEAVTEGIDSKGKEAMQKLVKITKATAPKGKRGNFKKNIAMTTQTDGRMKKYIWHVKAPDYRLTHLIVHGHATKNGGRTEPNPFLQNALDQVLPEYERDIEEVLKNGQ